MYIEVRQFVGPLEDPADALQDGQAFIVPESFDDGEFDREALDFSEAVSSAITAIESAVPGARVINVHRDQDVAAAG